MRKSNTQSLGEVLKDYVKAMRLEKKLDEVRLINSWEELMGKKIANSTTKIYIQNQILYVHLRSSVIRHELTMLRSAILEKINEQYSDRKLKEIRFL